ncbi:GNAT family N-acetyltransferase [Vibrio gazogenes]|uniref:GNAT family N-acetyltransferase n=1 Tax=Vibrio gazogenes TaxID=687 RepID=A0A1Z2SCA7_VIBGA|nr:GNAT family N-acetyltransferase [Vibrio gazogenes]ASA54814.1 GNAT family N-acetyltransferase [Vibrio gazogenes]
MIKIRNYKESDAQALWKIFYHTIHNVNIRDYSQAQVSAWAPDRFDFAIWQRKMDSILPVIAEIDGEIVGYTDIQSSGLIDHFFCHHEHQGKGIGRCLMEHIIAVGKAKGITRFYSEVSITARPFYEKLGFTVVKEQTVEMRGEKLQNFVMEKFS